MCEMLGIVDNFCSCILSVAPICTGCVILWILFYFFRLEILDFM